MLGQDVAAPLYVVGMAEKKVSVTREITAAPEVIFDLLADPSRHADFDGSGMVQQSRSGSTRLALGSKFGMDMKMGPLPYRVTSTVKEFEENRLIAWAHFGKHRWRYELEPVGGDDATGPKVTRVTETFDWSTAPMGKFIELAGYPKKHPVNMAATLERLAALVET